MTNASGKMSELLTQTSNSVAESRAECTKEASLSLEEATPHALTHAILKKAKKPQDGEQANAAGLGGWSNSQGLQQGTLCPVKVPA